MSERKICVNLYGDGSRDAKLRAETIFCDKSDVCSAYACEKCFNVTAFLSPHCPFGRINRYGYHTKRAKAYSKLYRETKSDPVYAALDYPREHRLVTVGDYALIRLAYISWDKQGETIRPNDPGFRGGEILSIKIDELTTEFLGKVIDFRPRALMDGVIQDYREKEIPRFLHQLKNLLPEVYKALEAAKPEVTGITPNFIGMRARLKTLNKDGTYRDCHGNCFKFCGEDELICEDYARGFKPFDCPSAIVKFRATDSMTYKIDDNSQVTENTVFV